MTTENTMNLIIADVRALVTSPIKEVADAAVEALKLQDKLAKDMVSAAEFKDLLNDIVDLSKIKEEMYEIETYRLINKAFNTIMTLKTLASLI